MFVVAFCCIPTCILIIVLQTLQLALLTCCSVRVVSPLFQCPVRTKEMIMREARDSSVSGAPPPPVDKSIALYTLQRPLDCQWMLSWRVWTEFNKSRRLLMECKQYSTAFCFTAFHETPSWALSRPCRSSPVGSLFVGFPPCRRSPLVGSPL